MWTIAEGGISLCRALHFRRLIQKLRGHESPHFISLSIYDFGLIIIAQLREQNIGQLMGEEPVISPDW